MWVLACLPRWPTRYGHLSLKKLPVGYASPSRQFFLTLSFCPIRLYLFFLAWLHGNAPCARRPEKTNALSWAKILVKKSRGFLGLTLLPSSQHAKCLVFRKNTLKKPGGIFGDMPCAWCLEKHIAEQRTSENTIGNEQLAHTKVGVGVTQANLGHGWLARSEHPLPRPNWASGHLWSDMVLKKCQVVRSWVKKRMACLSLRDGFLEYQ